MHSAARRLAVAAAASVLGPHAPAAATASTAWPGHAALGAGWAAIGRVAAGLHTASSSTDIRAVMADKIPVQQARLKHLKKTIGTAKLGEVTVDMAIGGMRGITGLLWETSLLDPEEGIRFRGYSIPECQARLPAAQPGGQPLPEGLLWLLLTGDLPTPAQAAALSAELGSRARLPAHVGAVLDALPAGTHPMTALGAGVLALQPRSRFAAAYQAGTPKGKLWESSLDDALDLLGALPALAARIYRATYHAGSGPAEIAPEAGLDWGANLAVMMGHGGQGARELMRLYLTIHADHEGGNVSAHTAHVVGSALADPYLSFAAGMAGLAGPLHGLANQEVLRWLSEAQARLGARPAKADVEAFVKATLASGQVVPGYGHAVLRKTDPRYTCQREFALAHLPDDPLFRLVSDLYEVVPGVLAATGKVKNPWPNVDAHSGVLLTHFGITEATFYTVLFGVSRAIGVLAQGVWSRALGLPIERPKSTTMDALEAQFGSGVKA